MKDWTPEQVQKAARYGVCPVCGAPRDSWRIEETHPDGQTTVIRNLICTKEPLKHPQKVGHGTGPKVPPIGSAYFSACRTWRYSLTRNLDTPDGRGRVTFIGLNPSTADETIDDPTIRRCIRFARDWGYAQLKMVNLYALRSTDPKGLWRVDDPVGPENEYMLAETFEGSDLIVAAWGANARPDRLWSFAQSFDGEKFHALGVTKSGAPRHPLYMRADSQPVPYRLVA